MNRVGQAMASTAVVSGASHHLSCVLDRASPLTLSVLSELTRLVDATILHDRVIYFVPYIAEVMAPRLLEEFRSVFEDKDLVVAARFDAAGTFCPLLEPMAPEAVKHDTARIETLLRLMRDPNHVDEKVQFDRQRDPLDLLRFFGDQRFAEIVQVEMRFSEQTESTYYSTVKGSLEIDKLVRQFGLSAERILRTFGEMRSEQLREVEKLLGGCTVGWSPPLLLAHAVGSAGTLDGFFRAVGDLT